MIPSHPLEKTRIAIVGLGLMGGSLGLALKGHCRELLGIDSEPAAVDMALDQGVVERASTKLESLLPEAEIIILAAPVGAILDLIKNLPVIHPGRAMVMDLGSTKVKICQALNHLPERFYTIGGHPMCGKETSGLENAEAGLYWGATFVLTPLDRTTTDAKSMAVEIVRTIGARPLWLDPELHDRWTAATSHMPYLISTALALATPQEAAPLAGPGFHSTSRLAGSSIQMMQDILTSNRENVLAAVSRFHHSLDEIRSALENGDERSLVELLRRGKAARERLLWAAEKGEA